MNNELTLIFTDLDGTLLDHFTYDHSAVHKTLEQLKAKHIPVICNTSKTFAETIVLREELTLKSPFIVENGAAVYIPKKLCLSQPDGTENSGDFWVKSFTQPRQHWLDIINTYKSDHDCQFVGFSALSHKQLMAITGLTLTQATLAKQREYSEPIQWAGNDEHKNSFIQYLKDSGANVLQGGRFMHVSGFCNKGLAMQWLVSLYENRLINTSNKNQNNLVQKLIPVKSIALGDSYNDVAMLNVADIAVLIRSPVHDFPNLERSNKATTIRKSIALGPQGWADEINTLCLTKRLKTL